MPLPKSLSTTPDLAPTSQWTAAHVAAIAGTHVAHIPVISASDARAIVPGIDLWDSWPLQLENGANAVVSGGTLWFMLSAPALPDPNDRHGQARIRLLLERDGAWFDCGNALPDGLSPGNREWAGSAVFEPATGAVTLYFTAAGYRGEAPQSFAQRLFQTVGQLGLSGETPRITHWSAPTESVTADGLDYVIVNQTDGAPGFIKGFRDPAFFRDPANGQAYLLFTGSLASSDHAFNGCIGIARRAGSGWQLLSPLVDADTLNNELERPHMIVRDGHYYLFWSTQRRVFAPDAPNGPNGLYGLVAENLFGPYRPINGTGLVAANPAQEPLQSYSWWVMDSLEVASFVDHWGVQGRSFDDHPDMLRGQFGGTPAPRFRLLLEEDKVSIA